MGEAHFIQTGGDGVDQNMTFICAVSKYWASAVCWEPGKVLGTELGLRGKDFCRQWSLSSDAGTDGTEDRCWLMGHRGQENKQATKVCPRVRIGWPEKAVPNAALSERKQQALLLPRRERKARVKAKVEENTFACGRSREESQLREAGGSEHRMVRDRPASSWGPGGTGRPFSRTLAFE